MTEHSCLCMEVDAIEVRMRHADTIEEDLLRRISRLPQEIADRLFDHWAEEILRSGPPNSFRDSEQFWDCRELLADGLRRAARRIEL